jgi:hypothetical protein
MTKKKIPVVKPLAVPKPCVIDELPEVVTCVDRFCVAYCTPDVEMGYLDGATGMRRFTLESTPSEIRYVAGVE